ncbi:MAG: glycosyltransferase [Limnohabitans sp.]
MRIVMDMQGAQTESRFRGIGRYTLELARAIAVNSQGHELILVLNAALPEGEAHVRRAFDGILPSRQILSWHAPAPVRGIDPANTRHVRLAEKLREAFMASLNPDIVHISSFFEGWVDDAVTSLRQFDHRTVISVTLHDLIPLINANRYLKPNPAYASYYLGKVKQLRHADLLLAVSESSLQEGIHHLGYPCARIFNTSEGVDAIFRPIEVTQAQRQSLQDWAIQGEFVLYTGGSDERKNLPKLLVAWAAMSSVWRKTHQLVLAGRFPEADIQQLRHIAQRLGLGEHELIFTGYTTDEELVVLYNLCRLFVFPSWHEGFGLPVLEAMACGAPVLAANTTSLPEVLGLEEASFPPENEQVITALMTRALADPLWRQKLREHGLQQACQFSWAKTAQKALQAWAQQSTPVPTLAWKDWMPQAAQIRQQLIADTVAQWHTNPHSLEGVQALKNIARAIDHNEKTARYFHGTTDLPSKLTWRIEGPFDSSYSLALLNRELARGLSAIGHEVVLHSTEGPGDFDPDVAFLRAHPDLQSMHAQALQTSALDSNICSRNLYPPRSSNMQAPWNFMHAYGWEESTFPHEWAQDFNDNLQGMTVMSEHCRKVLIDSGVSIPIEVSGIGVDHWERVQAEPEYRLQARKFRFLHVSSCFPRKGADAMLTAYGQAFNGRDDVSLIIKTFANPHNQIHEWLRQARLNHADYPHVILIEDDLKDTQLKALYGQCHALIAPSRAEGFGLPMAEAMLSGLAVITTGWSGQTDFCTEDTAWLIDYDFAKAQTHFGLFDSIWVNPRIDHMASLMRKIWRMPEEQRQTRALAGRQRLMQHFKWTDVAQRNEQALRRIATMPAAPAPRIAWISTWNSRCGIAAYSGHLLAPIDWPIHIHAPYTADTISADDQNVTRCWHMDGQDDLNELSRSVQRQATQIVVIQFNYGFFNFDHLDRFMREQHQAGRLIIISLHATMDPAHAPQKKLAQLVSALRLCERVIVHTPNDLNRLKALGLTSNVTLIPLGVLDQESAAISPMRPNQTVRLASYGFFLPHKGLPELIEAVALLRDNGYDVELDMVNAEYCSPESTQAIALARNSIERLGLTPFIRLQTRYLSDKQSIELLASAQLVIFPYQNTGESASAAVRFGIATGRDVAVTPLDIFSDIQDIAHKLPGCTPKEMAQGIQDWIIASLQNQTTLSAMRERATRWRQQHRYSQLAKRWQGMMGGLARQCVKNTKDEP